jgi:hypothetical protein
VRHDRRVPAVPPQPTETCPGCGAVLVRAAGPGPLRGGASTACGRLFEDTLRGLREEAAADPAAAAVARLADAAYDAQHPAPADPGRLRAGLEVLGVPSTADGEAVPFPRAWRTTIADVAADLDVIDLPALVRAWADAVREDWQSIATRR